MSTRILSIGGLLALALGIVGVAVAADTPSASSSGSSTAPTATTYITVGDIVGEVTKVDSNAITVRVTWVTMVQKANTNGNRNMGNWNRGTSGRGPQAQMQHQMMMQQRMMANMVPKQQHHDYAMNFTDDAKARILHLPKKEGGYNTEEFNQLKGNPNLPGFISELGALKVGQVVEAHVVHPKGDTKNNQVRWALILNEPSGNSAATASNKPAPKKNK